MNGDTNTSQAIGGRRRDLNRSRIRITNALGRQSARSMLHMEASKPFGSESVTGVACGGG